MMSRSLLWSVPLILLVSACTPLLPTPEPVVAPSQHVLQPDTLPAEQAPRTGAPVLAVVAVSAGPLLDGRSMLYRDDSGRTFAFAEHRWLAPPEAQLTSWLVAAMERAGGVSAVVAPAGRGQASLLLDTELLTLHLDSEPAPGAVQLELRLQLVVSRSREVLATTRLREAEPLTETGPAAMAAASARALARLLDASAAFVRETIASRPGTVDRG